MFRMVPFGPQEDFHKPANQEGEGWSTDLFCAKTRAADAQRDIFKPENNLLSLKPQTVWSEGSLLRALFSHHAAVVPSSHGHSPAARTFSAGSARPCDMWVGAAFYVHSGGGGAAEAASVVRGLPGRWSDRSPVCPPVSPAAVDGCHGCASMTQRSQSEVPLPAADDDDVLRLHHRTGHRRRRHPAARLGRDGQSDYWC